MRCLIKTFPKSSQSQTKFLWISQVLHVAGLPFKFTERLSFPKNEFKNFSHEKHKFIPLHFESLLNNFNETYVSCTRFLAAAAL